MCRKVKCIENRYLYYIIFNVVVFFLIKQWNVSVSNPLFWMMSYFCRVVAIVNKLFILNDVLFTFHLFFVKADPFFLHYMPFNRFIL